MEKAKKIFDEYKMIVLMNIIVFIVVYFGIGTLTTLIKPIFWRILFPISIIIITDVFYILRKIKYEQVLCGYLVLYPLNLIFLKYFERKDLFGITNYDFLDKCPSFIDALFVVMIIVFIEYLTLLLTRFIINRIRKDIKEDKPSEKKDIKEDKIIEKKDNKKDNKKNTKKGKKNID